MLPTCTKFLADLPPYLFVKLDAVKEKALRKGLDIIDIGMGNPDRPSPKHVVNALCQSVRQHPATHRYPQTKGIKKLRHAIAAWYEKRFGVVLNPDTEVLPLLGSKEGIAHLYFAYLTPSDAALIPNPCYPVHYNAALLMGAHTHLMPLVENKSFLPDFDDIPARVADKAKILMMNYPNNPTGAVLSDLSLFERAVHFAKRRHCMVVHDNAYSEVTFDGYKAPSFLQLPQAKKFGVEFHSFSKIFSMAGWRIGFVVGNAEVLANLSKFKSFLDYGVPGFIQEAATEALNGPQSYVDNMRRIYQERRDVLVRALDDAGWPVASSRGSMYLWARIPDAFNKAGSFAFAEKLILEEGVVVAPGTGFGPCGEGFVRLALVEEPDRLREAARRIGRFLHSSAPAGAKRSGQMRRPLLLHEH